MLLWRFLPTKRFSNLKDFARSLLSSIEKEIALAIRYVQEVIECKWLIDEEFLDKHNIDLLVHGDDNVNPVPPERTVIYPRTIGISSTQLELNEVQD